MLLESGGQSDGIPHTVQAMISARIDRLPETERTVLRRAAVAGRVFWSGAIEELGDSPIKGGELHDLVERDFLVLEPRSTIRGEEAYRFKHVLIRDVAYAGLSKSSRALLHRQMAQWLAERPVADELVEIRAYHLDVATQLAEELEGAVPDGARDRGGRCPRAGGSARARARGEQRRAQALLALRRARAEPRAALPRGPRCVAHVRLPDRLGRDARGERGGEQRGRSPGRGSRPDRARARVAVPRRRQRLRAGARRQGARRRRGGRRRGAVRCARGDRHGLVLGGRPRGGRAAGERAARDRGADRARRPPERRAARAERRLQRPPRDRAGPRAARARDRARRDEREPDDAGLDPARVRPAGRDRGPAGRRRGRARRGASDLHRERRGADARPNAELARSRALGQARPPRRRGDPAGGDPPAQADPGPGNDGREPAPPGAGAARPGAPRGGGALRPRVARDRRRRGRVVALDDAACARARPGGAGKDDEAERLLREAEEILRPTGFRRHQIAPLEALAEFLRARDRDDEAAEVEEALARSSGSRSSPTQESRRRDAGVSRSPRLRRGRGST